MKLERLACLPVPTLTLAAAKFYKVVFLYRIKATGNKHKIYSKII